MFLNVSHLMLCFIHIPIADEKEPIVSNKKESYMYEKSRKKATDSQSVSKECMK